MKFKDFLEDIKNNELSDYERFSLYEKIISKTSYSRFSIFRMSFKQVAYLGILVFLIVGIYGSYFLNTTTLDEDNIFLVRHDSNIVNADYIAKVIEFTGDFHIEKNKGTEISNIKTSTIINNDTIVLKSGTTMQLTVIDGSDIMIIGPARFSINKEKNSPYRLYLEEGLFTSIKNEKEEKKKKENMEVIVNDEITITSPEDDTTNFQITKKGEEYFVNNKGKPLTVSNKTSKKKILKQDRVLTIRQGNDISTIQNKEEFAAAISTKDISQSFDLNQPIDSKLLTINNNLEEPQEQSASHNTLNEDSSNTLGKILQKDEKEKKDKEDNKDISNEKQPNIQNISDIEIDETVLKNFVDNKKIFNDKQQKQIDKSINHFFVKTDSINILTYHLLGDQNRYEKEIKNLNKKFIILGKSLGSKMLDGSDLGVLKKNIQIIKGTLENEYYTPERYINDLNTFIKRIDIIEKTEFGSMTDINMAEQLARTNI